MTNELNNNVVKKGNITSISETTIDTIYNDEEGYDASTSKFLDANGLKRVREHMKNENEVFINNTEASSVIHLQEDIVHPFSNLTLYGKSYYSGTPLINSPTNIMDIEQPTLVVSNGNFAKYPEIGASVTYETAATEGREAYITQSIYTAHQAVTYRIKGIDGQITVQAEVKASTDTPCILFFYEEDISSGVNYELGLINPELGNTATNQATAVTVWSAVKATSVAGRKVIAVRFGANKEGTVVRVNKESVLIAPAEQTNQQIIPAEQKTLTLGQALRGIVAAEGSQYNYTDKAGNNWICDEIDFKRKKYIQRVEKIVIDKNTPYLEEQVIGATRYFRYYLGDNAAYLGGKEQDFCIDTMCSHYSQPLYNDEVDTPHYYLSHNVINLWVPVNANWFNTNTVTILYALSKPIERELFEEENSFFQNLTSYEKDTYIYSNYSDLDMILNYTTEKMSPLNSSLEPVLEQKQNQILKESCGNIIAINDGIKEPITSLHLYGKSILDREPSKETPAEIINIQNTTVDFYETNLFNSEIIQTKTNFKGLNFQPYFGGTRITGTSTETFVQTSGLHEKLDLPPGDYKMQAFSLGGVTGTSLRWLLNEDGNNIRSAIVNKDEVYFTVKPESIYKVFIDIPDAGAQLSAVTRLLITPILSKQSTWIAPKKKTLSFPYTLRGIPVPNSGNYVDKNGQSWICDEIDFSRGVYIQRILRKRLTNLETYAIASSGSGLIIGYDPKTQQNFSKITGLYNLGPFITDLDQQWVYQGSCLAIHGNYGPLITIDGIKTLPALNQFLADNEVIIEGILAEPIETPLENNLKTSFMDDSILGPNYFIVSEGAEIKVSYPTIDTENNNEIMQTIASNKADLPIQTFTGKKIFVSNNAAYPLINLKVYGNFIGALNQPSPDSPSIISPLSTPTIRIDSGNLFDTNSLLKNHESVVYSVKDNFITVQGPAPYNQVFYELDLKPYTGLTLYSTGEIIYKTGTSAINLKITFTDGTIAYYTSLEHGYIVPENAASLTVQLISNNTDSEVAAYTKAIFANVSISLTKNLTNKTYKATDEITPNYWLFGLPVTDNGNYTDTNGQQWICDEIDFKRNKFIQRINYTDTGAAELIGADGQGWQYSEIYKIFYNNVYLGHDSVFCSHYPYRGAHADSYIPNENQTMTSFGNLLGIRIKDTNYTDVTSFKEYLQDNNVKIVYPLLTPIETDLSSDLAEAFRKIILEEDGALFQSDKDTTISVTYATKAAKDFEELLKPYNSTGIILNSSDSGSTKRFLITINDSGTLSAKEI